MAEEVEKEEKKEQEEHKVQIQNNPEPVIQTKSYGWLTGSWLVYHIFGVVFSHFYFSVFWLPLRFRAQSIDSTCRAGRPEKLFSISSGSARASIEKARL